MDADSSKTAEGPETVDPSGQEDEHEAQPTKPLSTKGSFGTAVGAAMLGFEQALRDGPPPQIQAAERTPDQSQVTGTADVVIDFPEPRTEPIDEHEPIDEQP
jgi:hypothetical protein